MSQSSVACSYFIVLKNQLFSTVAVFDSFSDLKITEKVNDVGTCSFSLSGYDDRTLLFDLDGMIQIIRSVPDCGLTPYAEFTGLHRTEETKLSDTGEYRFSSSSVSLVELLARRIVNYPAATIKSYKNVNAISAMNQYVEENCGLSATVVNGRLSASTFPMFTVDGSSYSAPVWEGDRAFENLLDVLKDLAKFSSSDFDVKWIESTPELRFMVYPGQLGTDRTVTGLQNSTGRNSSGNIPVVLAPEYGNSTDLKYTYSRESEANLVSVLGDGDGATREVQVRSLPSSADSPFNLREVSRPQSGFENEMQVFGDEVLAELRARKTISFSPIQQSTCLYGKDYFLGDRISVNFRGETFSRRITEVSIDVTKGESISLVVSEF